MTTPGVTVIKRTALPDQRFLIITERTNDAYPLLKAGG
jgi:hypothetical protein